MSTVQEIIKAAESLDAEQFLKLRKALDRVEEQLGSANPTINDAVKKHEVLRCAHVDTRCATHFAKV